MPTQQPKKPKAQKANGIVFRKEKTKGEVRYPPCKVYSKEVMEKLGEFEVFPTTQIGEYCQYIPYNSEKKTFLEKTGRGGFEVFGYLFRVPDDDRQHAVMWDYNIGLVRITSFFKCLKFQKASGTPPSSLPSPRNSSALADLQKKQQQTVPSRAIGNNPGLREICHSITGGSVMAQGYWMPFEAARALTATFCYPIRHVLVPLFSEDFLALCTVPPVADVSGMVIDEAITRKCAEVASYFRQHERTPSPLEPSSSMTPPGPSRRRQQRRRAQKSKSKSKSLSRRPKSDRSSDSGCGGGGSGGGGNGSGESGYCSDTTNVSPCAVSVIISLPSAATRLGEKRSWPQLDHAIVSQQQHQYQHQPQQQQNQQPQQQQQQQQVPFSHQSDEEHAARLIMELHKADYSLRSKRRRFSL